MNFGMISLRITPMRYRLKYSASMPGIYRYSLRKRNNTFFQRGSPLRSVNLEGTSRRQRSKTSTRIIDMTRLAATQMNSGKSCWLGGNTTPKREMPEQRSRLTRQGKARASRGEA